MFCQQPSPSQVTTFPSFHKLSSQTIFLSLSTFLSLMLTYNLIRNPTGSAFQIDTISNYFSLLHSYQTDPGLLHHFPCLLQYPLKMSLIFYHCSIVFYFKHRSWRKPLKVQLRIHQSTSLLFLKSIMDSYFIYSKSES